MKVSHVDATSTVSTGRCVCEDLRYQLNGAPLFTHTCHCLDCQRKTGTAFAMTTIVLRDDLVITHGRTVATPLSPRSTAYACAQCQTTIYVASTRFPFTVTLRPGTLDDPAVATPQAHIWIRRKQAWLTLPEDVPQFHENYDRDTTWPAASLERMRAAERSSL
jgi:hypothetical protein